MCKHINWTCKEFIKPQPFGYALHVIVIFTQIADYDTVRDFVSNTRN